jgi:hypothetical protein
MKAITIIIVLCVVLSGRAIAQGNTTKTGLSDSLSNIGATNTVYPKPVKDPEAVQQRLSPRPPTEIRTLDGRTYRVVNVQKVEPDGLFVEFVPAGGGIGLTKIKFRDLPDSFQQQYGYTAEKAAAYEAAQAKEAAEVSAKVWADYADATNRLAIRLAKQEAEERAEAERVQIAKEQADAERRRLDEERRRIDATAIEVPRRDDSTPPPYVQPVGPYGRQLRGAGQR